MIIKDIKKILALLAAALILLSACGAESEGTDEAGEASEATIDFFAMDTYMSMKACGPEASAALSTAEDIISDMDGRLSVTNEKSEIYAINHACGGETKVSAETMSLLKEALSLSEETGDALEISIYPVSLAWGFTTGEYRVPEEEELGELLTHVDDSRILLDEESLTVTIPEGAQIDLGAFAKGMAGDRAAEQLKEDGITSALLNLGSSTIRTIGAKPDGSPWRVAIADPEKSSDYAGIIELYEGAVNTSGGYERYFTDEAGKVYWHILDPINGYPADSGIISATILTPDSMTGDGLSTACFVMGLEKTEEYWREKGGFEFILITEDHDIYVSEGAADAFTPAGDYEKSTVTVVPYEE